jgi:hypothetical protein
MRGDDGSVGTSDGVQDDGDTARTGGGQVERPVDRYQPDTAVPSESGCILGWGWWRVPPNPAPRAATLCAKASATPTPATAGRHGVLPRYNVVLCLKKSDVFDFWTSCLTVHLI